MSNQDKVKKAVQLFSDAGLSVSPKAMDLLSVTSNPEGIVKEILENMQKMKFKLLVILPEHLENSQSSFYMFANNDWDFVNANTQRFTHGLHPYPARMVPQIAYRLIKRYSKPYDLVLDPFCGSGTVPTEARIMKSDGSNEGELPRNAIGNEINPLALLLSKVKSEIYDVIQLDKNVSSLLVKIEDAFSLKRRGKYEQKTPTEADFPRLNYWFKADVIEDLAIINDCIDIFTDVDFRNFADVCFSLTVLKVSNIYNSGDTFVKRLKPQELRKHHPKVLETFKAILTDSVKKVKDFSRLCSKETEVNIMFSDARNLPLSSNSIDLIVTSPPYGEEKNTVSYTRWSKLSSLWLGYESSWLHRLEKISLGGKNYASFMIPSDTLNRIMLDVAKQDPALARTANSFFQDYYTCLEEMARVLRSNHYCCIVIGNRSLKRRRIPMDIVTKELGEKVGLKHETTHFRKIPTKAIPWVCAKGETIAHESIVVLKKGG